MTNKEKNEVVINDLTERFIEAVEMLVSRGIKASYKEISDELEWNEAALSSVRKRRINVPNKYIKTFEKVYKIPIITNIANEDIQNRLLRIEATLEVYGISIAGLKAKKIEDFEDRFSELQKLISEAVKRRKGI